MNLSNVTDGTATHIAATSRIYANVTTWTTLHDLYIPALRQVAARGDSMVRQKFLRERAAMLGLVSALAFGGCAGEESSTDGSSENEGQVGNFGLGLVLPDGSEVNEVTYTITRSGMTVRTGTIPVGADGHARAT